MRLLVLVLVGVLLGCTNRYDNVVHVTAFPTEEHIGYEPIPVEQLDPFNITFMDSLMILTEAKGDFRFRIFHRKGFRHLMDYGIIGRGPGEYLHPQILNQKGSDSSSIYIYDISLSTIFEVDLAKVFNRENPIKNRFSLKLEDFEWGLSSSSFYLYDKIIVGEDSYKGLDRRFFSFDPYKNDLEWIKTDFYDRTPTMKSFLRKVKAKNKNDDFIQGNYAQGVLAYAPAENKIVSAMLQYNRIDIMNFEFNILKTIVYGKNILAKTDYNNNQFERPLLFPKSFLVPYYLGVDYDKNIEENRKLGFEIHQYDYRGNPLRKFTIDAPVMSLYYDEQIGVIYGILHEEYTEKPLVKLNINPDYLD